MKRITCILLAAAILATAAPEIKAAAATDPMTRVRLHSLTAKSRLKGPAREEAEISYIPLIMMIDTDNEDLIDSMTGYGVKIYNRRDNLLLAAVPSDYVYDVIELPGVIEIAVTGEPQACLDVARPLCWVDAVQEGTSDLPHGYDGTGVIVGFTDTGFYSGHINFKDRVAAIHDYDAYSGSEKHAITPSQIAEWTTDNDDETHATHVCGILSGGYRPNGYYGVAPGAQIVATTSRLSDVGILSGVEDIIAYAREVGKPAVINMSLANHLGPHDGTSLQCRYLASCAKEVPICIAAGNKGHRNASAWQILSEEDPEARVFVNSLITWAGFDVSGYTEIWSNNAEPFEFRFEVYDLDTSGIVYASPWIGGNTGHSSLYITPDSSASWGTYFQEGYVYAEAGVSPLNGRYCVATQYDNHSDTPSNMNSIWGKYYTSLAVRASSGSPAVTYFVDNNTSYLTSIKGENTIVGARGSINDMCTAEGVISVGSFDSRNSVPTLDGGTESWSYPTGVVTPSSSFCNLPDYPVLPHFCAPGRTLISSLSTPYYEKHPMTPQAKATVDGVDYWWFETGGTSMAAPFAAGVFALWLQASPDLSGSELLEIARSTARNDYADIADPRWGSGSIDALSGLREVIRRSSLEDNPTALPLVEVTDDGYLSVTAPMGAEIHVYTPDGREVSQSSRLRNGIYIVNIKGIGSRKVRVVTGE